jgi:ketosteroid isomerase-like protein
LHDHWVVAFDSGDAALLDKMETDSFVLVSVDGKTWKKSDREREDVAAKPRNYSRPVYGKRKLSDEDVQSFGDSATLTGKLATTTAAGTQLAAATVLFVRQEGKWRIARVQWSKIVDDK